MPENRPDTITEGIPTTATSKHYTATRMAVKGGSNAIHKHDNGIVIDQSVADPGWCYTGYLHVIFFSSKIGHNWICIMERQAVNKIYNKMKKGGKSEMKLEYKRHQHLLSIHIDYPNVNQF